MGILAHEVLTCDTSHGPLNPFDTDGGEYDMNFYAQVANVEYSYQARGTFDDDTVPPTAQWLDGRPPVSAVWEPLLHALLANNPNERADGERALDILGNEMQVAQVGQPGQSGQPGSSTDPVAINSSASADQDPTTDA